MVKIGLMAGIVLLLVGCSQWAEQGLETPKIPVSATEGNSMQTIQPAPTPANSSLQHLIEKAKQDLAQRLSMSTDQISLMEAKEVIWPDSSLGCPQEGMVYAQVLTPGYLILLEFDSKTFEYHTGRETDITYCENPLPPFQGTPDNT